MGKQIAHIPISLWVIVIISLINFVQFTSIDSKNVLNYRAISTYETSDITVIGMRSETARTKWLEWITLGKVAPNSLVYLPKDSYFNQPEYIASMHAFGKTRRTKLLDDVPAIDIDNLIKDKLVATGEDIVMGNPAFAIAINIETKPNLIEHRIKGLMTEHNQPQYEDKEFLLLEWSNPLGSPFHKGVDGMNITFYSLLVDVSLLPEEYQKEIRQ